MDQKTMQKSAFKGNGDFDSDLSISHEIKTPSIEDVLMAAKKAIAAAQITIDNSGGRCGCF